MAMCISWIIYLGGKHTLRLSSLAIWMCFYRDKSPSRKTAAAVTFGRLPAPAGNLSNKIIITIYYNK